MQPKDSFFQRLFNKEPLVPPPTSYEARLDALERTLKAAILDWDDALDRLQRLAGRASKLKHLQAQPETERTRAQQINDEILARRAKRAPTNGAH